mmetsp:Transcript_861/g.1341  ORF Transcript_861/g.1341 Transcript_861/m.1341 type:complete len:442 (-) Transcript_861:201-1526(-)
MNRNKSKSSNDAGNSSGVKKRRKSSKRSSSSSTTRKLEMIFCIGILLQIYVIVKTSDLSRLSHGGGNDTQDVGGAVQGATQSVGQGSQNVEVGKEESELILKPSEILAKYDGQNVDTLVSDTERTKSIIASRLGLMEASTDIVDKMSKINISIVVSHCEENIKWIANYVGKEYVVKDITIYSKCDKNVRGLKELEALSSTINVIKLPNVGRCDHTYANWIQEHYASIAKETDGNDIVMFLKDHARYRRKYLPIDLLFSQTTRSGFACVTKPICDCDKKCLNGFHVPTMQHKRDYLLDFSLNEYKRVDRDENSVFLSDEYKSLKKWNEKMGFVIPQSETMPVCYGGIFAAQKKQVLNQSEESWKKMEMSLSRADNIIEGHYAERMWASLLSDLNIDSAMAVDEVLSPHVVKMVRRPKGDLVCGMAGMLYVHKNSKITVPGDE